MATEIATENNDTVGIPIVVDLKTEIETGSSLEKCIIFICLIES